MFNLQTQSSTQAATLPEYLPVQVNLDEMITRVCARIPPLWDLENYVAVNPFLGFAGEPLIATARTVRDGLGAHLLPALAFYQRRWRDHAFNAQDLAHAARRAGYELAGLADILSDATPMPTRLADPLLTFAERHDQEYGTDWNAQIVRHVAQWCALYTAGGSQWRWQQSAGLYAAWRAAAPIDRSLEIAGLRGWRDWARELPDTPEAAISAALARLAVPVEQQEAYLYRALGGLYGWASYLRRAVWQSPTGETGDLLDLLAIRVCADVAVAQLAPRRQPVAVPRHVYVEDEAVLAIFQDALEDGYARQLFSTLAPAPQQGIASRPAVQAVFCIDVRSEVFRRHFEAQHAQIETRGFAGFFGVALDWRVGDYGSERCPVLLKPGVAVQANIAASVVPEGALKTWQSAPAAAFTFVETFGLAYGLGLLGDAFNRTPSHHDDGSSTSFQLDPDEHGSGIAHDQRVEMAAGILKNMGLHDNIARVVALVGHGGRSTNNAHAAGLDCGACGGHSGAANARVAAALLNDRNVRVGLNEHGWRVPADTIFVAGLHDTSVDEVALLDAASLPASHAADLAQLTTWLAAAGAAARNERARTLGVAAKPANILHRLLDKRARDWSEVRPEWALARNAAFIAARRTRTRGVDLAGRAFLHEYDWTLDDDSSVLRLILSAPMVVASWINLQYFASTVDNQVFGCGTKALHNRVGTLGVVLGNGGDLRTGLALQSLQGEDGEWYHEPLRLQVVVEAPLEKITAELDALPQVRELIENGWVRLFALDPDSDRTTRWVPGQGWA